VTKIWRLSPGHDSLLFSRELYLMTQVSLCSIAVLRNTLRFPVIWTAVFVLSYLPRKSKLSQYTLQYCERWRHYFTHFCFCVKRSSVNNAPAALRLEKKPPLRIPWCRGFIAFNIRFWNSLQNIQNYFIHFRSFNYQCLYSTLLIVLLIL